MTSLNGSGAPAALPRVIEEVVTGLYLRISVETEPILTDDDQEALLAWAEENLPKWEWHDCSTPERDVWEFVIEYDPEG